MAHHDILQDIRRSSHARGPHRKHDARAAAATQFTSTGGTETFTGVNSVPSNSLLLGSGSPTTQYRSSGLLTQSGNSATLSTPSTTSSTTSDTASVTPGVNTPAPGPSTSSSGFVSNHKLLLAGVIAGFVALVLVVAIVVWLFVRRARRKREEETVARQSFAAGAALAGSRGKETFAMSEASLFKGPPLHSASAHTKKGSRSDDWNGLSSRDDHYPPDDAANDAASVRTGGLRSPYNQQTQPYQLTLGSIAQSRPESVHLTAVPPYTLTGAFATALSAEDDEERDVSVANHSSSHAGSPKIERGPVMHRVPQTQPHPHPYADPSVFASAVSAQGTPSYHAGGPRQQHQQAVFDALETGADEDNGAGLRPQPSPLDFLSFSPSTASAGQTGESALGKSATQDYFNLPMPEPSSPMIPPSPSSMYSQQPQSSVPAPAPGPVLSPSFRAQSTTPSIYTTNSSTAHNVGLSARPSTKQTKAERATNMRALGDLIAALDSVPSGGASATNSLLTPSDALDGRGGRPMPEAGMWRAALGSSPTLGGRQNSDSSARGKQR